jgi:polysaccharide export outer membrane protein
MKKYFVIVVAILSLFSCATKKQILYFQDIEELNLQDINQSFEPIIEANDILYISISSLNEELVKPFLRNLGVSPNNIATSNPGLQGYLVDSDGNIRFNVIGDISVGGKTRAEVITVLNEKLSEYIKDLVVDVRIINFNVTILGEVNAPGIYTIDDERVTLPEALALAGDFTLDGKRKDVLVIREEDGKRKVERIDFTKSDFFAGPFYFLKQNDIVYVEPSLKGVKKSGFISGTPVLFSLVSIILSTVILLTR